MAVMLGNLYAALRDIGVSEEHARKAAEEAAAIPDITELKKDVGQLKADVAVLKWMSGFIIAMVIGVIMLLLRIGFH